MTDAAQSLTVQNTMSILVESAERSARRASEGFPEVAMPNLSRLVTTVTAAMFLAGSLVVGLSRAVAGQGHAYQPPVQRFDVAPKVGEPLPDLTIVAADGSPANLRQLVRGRHTVLVLGCLT